MKKKNVLLGVIFFLMLFALTGCGKKTAITPSMFNTNKELLKVIKVILQLSHHLILIITQFIL